MKLQLVILLMRRNQRLVLPLFLTFMVLRNPSREFWISHNVYVAQKPFQTLGHIFAKLKDPITNEQLTDGFFSIPCNGCDHKYIGQTRRQFGTRLKEHQRAVSFCEKENLALSEHTCLINHTIGWDNSKIFTSYRCYHQSLCLKACMYQSIYIYIYIYIYI